MGEFIKLFDKMMVNDPREAMKWVFTLTVFNGLTVGSYAVGDHIDVSNIQAPKLYFEKAQGNVNSTNNISRKINQQKIDDSKQCFCSTFLE